MTVLPYIFGYISFLLGSSLYILSKVQDYKQIAKNNPNPSAKFSFQHFLEDEWINGLRLLIGGIALVIGMPMLVGGSTVDIKNVSGSVVTSLTLKNALLPMYFVLGYSGNSALFALFGKYKKTLLNQVGVDADDK